jgi:putative transcriptional regulator
MTTPGSTTDLSIDDHAAPNQARSARAFHIPRDLLADLELGRARADDALTAYLRVIDHAPDVVREALDRAGI